MPDSLTITGKGRAETATLAQVFKRYPDFAAGRVKFEIQETGKSLKIEMKRESSIGPLYSRSKRLERSWSDNVGGTRLADITGAVGSFVFYSEDHEKGGTFRPKKALWFWIPVNSNLTAKRTARVSVSKAQENIRVGLWRFASRARGSSDREIFGKSVAVIDENNEAVYILSRSKTLKKSLFFFLQGDQKEKLLIVNLSKRIDAYWADSP